MTSYGYANQWIVDPVPRNPGKTPVHRCLILVSKCKVDLIFGYRVLGGVPESNCVYAPGGGGGGAGHGVGI